MKLSVSEAFAKGLIGLPVGQAVNACVKLGYSTREITTSSRELGKRNQHDRITFWAPKGIVIETAVG